MESEYSCCIKRKIRSIYTKSINKALKFSPCGRKSSLGRTTLNPSVLFLLLFCPDIASLLYIKLYFCKYCSYYQVSLTSILRVATIGIRAYQFRNSWVGGSKSSFQRSIVQNVLDMSQHVVRNMSFFCVQFHDMKV